MQTSAGNKSRADVKES